MRALLLVAMAGCYSPASRASCTVSCAAGSLACPSGLECGADNLCKVAGEPTCNLQGDGGIDGPIVIGDGALCFGNGLLRICIGVEPAAQVFNFATTLDTSVAATCDLIAPTEDSGDLCVITGSSIDIAEHVTVIGTRPVVFLATDRFTIAVGGELDVSSLRGGQVGAAANDAGCAPRATISGTNGVSGAAGGGGGSFAGRGGTGGNGAGGSTLGGVPGQPQALDHLRGGCFAGNGGNGNGNTGGIGGNSGGAIYLIAGGTLEIDGTVNGSGAAGEGGLDGAGAGGGGTGGTIGLDAALVEIKMGARVFALGGGGGAGGGQGQGGLPGQQATSPTQFGTGAPGIAGNAGDGGTGSNPTTAQPGISGGAGGGGGGGGAGFIKVFSTMTPQIAPNAVAPPAS